MYSYQKFVEMLNYGIKTRLIQSDEAVYLLCREMPLTFHKGSWASQEHGGVMILKSRLVSWWKEDNDIQVRDIYNLLEVN